jgi:hypothetical protein
MAIFKIEDAEREGARLVLGIGGVSGSGKTYTALQVAWGLANYDSSKVGLLCTENRRGRLYANILVDANGQVHKFKVGDLTPPFSPARYIEAIQAFVQAGVEVLVIDSVSHEWEGQGGCEDIAHAGNSRNPEWNKAKREHKSFMNAMLQSPVHIIACMRAREKVKLEKVDGKTQYVPQGILPIQEKNFTFELTASLMMWNGGKQREVQKCPSELEPIFGATGEWAEGHLAHQHGKQLRDWVDGGRQLDAEVQRARDTLQMACEAGMDALVAAWKGLPAKMRKAISPNGTCPDDLKRSAEAFDQSRTSDDAGDLEDLNAEVLGTNA